ncbi:hypothetical protein Tco_1554841 [Tanacetum coccineum]
MVSAHTKPLLVLSSKPNTNAGVVQQTKHTLIDPVKPNATYVVLLQPNAPFEDGGDDVSVVVRVAMVCGCAGAAASGGRGGGDEVDGEDVMMMVM